MSNYKINVHIYIYYMAMSKAPTSPFHWSVGVWHVLSKPLPKVEIASTWELGISSSSSDGKVPSGETGEVEVD